MPARSPSFAVLATTLVLMTCGCELSRLWTFRAGGTDGGAANNAGQRTDAAGDTADTTDSAAATDARDSGPAPDAGAPPPAACTATSVPVNNPQLAPVCPTGVCGANTCDKDTEGALSMSYDIDPSDPMHAWAVCDFAVGQDFASFDAAYGNAGIVEAVFCVEGSSLAGALNLWYGKDPLRKKLPLVVRGEVLDPGCYVRYFTPEQARFPDWEAIPAACGGRCGAGTGSCSADFRAAITAYRVMDGGAEYDLEATHVALAAEDSVGSAHGQVRLGGVRVLSDGCLCADDTACATAGRPTCRAAPPTDCGSWPQDLLPGVCGPLSIGCVGAPGSGVACTVAVGDRVCSGVTACVEGTYVCPVSDCD